MNTMLLFVIFLCRPYWAHYVIPYITGVSVASLLPPLPKLYRRSAAKNSFLRYCASILMKFFVRKCNIIEFGT